MKHPLWSLLALLALALTAGTGLAADGENAEKSPVPLPSSEAGLVAETAQAWLAVSGSPILEGAIFDANGNLLFCDVSGRRVLRAGPDKTLETLVELPDLAPGGLALHRDGRLFMAALDLARRRGAILAWSPQTKALETILPVEAGYWPNDLVFAPDGGLYFSDFRGSATSPDGGVWYLSPDFTQVTPVIANLAQANGVALSPDGKTLWATEFAKNRLHRARLETPVSVSVIGSAIPYHFTGPAPDSMRVDSAGNVYVALYSQGRALIFNENGIPVGQILLPEREAGKNLLSASLALDPENNDVFLVSSSGEGGEGAGVFRASSLAPGQKAPAKRD